MEKGGYKIINLKDTNITTSGTVIRGVFDDIDKNNRKVILLSGLKINGTELNDEFVKAIKSGGQYTIHAYNVSGNNQYSDYVLTVESSDTVTLHVNTISGAVDNAFIVQPETPVTTSRKRGNANG